MGTHLIPRSDVKGQDRLFIFFSVQGLIGTVIAMIPALPIFLIFERMNKVLVGFAFLAAFGFVGFIIGQGKVPDGASFSLSKKVGGLYIRDVIKDWINFRNNKKKYVLEVEENQKFDTREETKIEKVVLNRE